jgi:hypothetical protein
MAYQGTIGTNGGYFVKAQLPSSYWTASSGVDHSSLTLIWKLPTWGWWTTPIAFTLLQARGLTGPGSLSGDIKKNGVLVARHILLVDRKARQIVDGTVSTGSGTFTFNGLPMDPQRFMVIGLFDPDVEETAIADYLTAG